MPRARSLSRGSPESDAAPAWRSSCFLVKTSLTALHSCRDCASLCEDDLAGALTARRIKQDCGTQHHQSSMNQIERFGRSRSQEAPCNNRKNTLTMLSSKRILPRLLSRKFFLQSVRAPFAKITRTLACGTAILTSTALAIASQNQPPKPVPPPPLVLAGGTIIDVTAWGHSANDIPDAIVYIRDGRILAVGPRASLPIPKGSRVIDCTGKYLIPGLIDGYAGMNSQGQASANLYMGVTTVVAASDERRGWVDQHASPTPHLYLIDSIGSTGDWSLLINRPEWSAKLKDRAGRS